MNEEDIIKAQKQELENLIRIHKLSCDLCNDSYLCNQAIQIVNDYIADQEQQGN